MVKMDNKDKEIFDIFKNLGKTQNKIIKNFGMLKESEFNKLVKDSEGIMKIQEELILRKTIKLILLEERA